MNRTAWRVLFKGSEIAEKARSKKDSSLDESRNYSARLARLGKIPENRFEAEALMGLCSITRMTSSEYAKWEELMLAAPEELFELDVDDYQYFFK